MKIYLFVNRFIELFNNNYIMTGGLIQLVARNNVDLYLTGDPQITYFKTIYRRHTNFTIEDIPLKFRGGNLNFGKTGQCKLETMGDMIHKLSLMTKLPKIDIVYKDCTVSNVQELLNKHNITWTVSQNVNKGSFLTNAQFLEVNDLINNRVDMLTNEISKIDILIQKINNENPSKNIGLSPLEYYNLLSNLLLLNSDYKTIFNFLSAHQIDFGTNFDDENLTNSDEIGLSIFRDFQRGAILRAAGESDINLFPLFATLTTTLDETVQIMTLFDSFRTDIVEPVSAQVFYQNTFRDFFPDDQLENFKKLDAYKFYQIFINDNPTIITTTSQLLDFKDSVINVINCSMYESFQITSDFFKYMVNLERFQVTFSFDGIFKDFDPLLPTAISDTQHMKFIDYSQDPFLGYENGTITCDSLINYKIDFNEVASQELGANNANFLNSSILKNYFDNDILWQGYDIGTILFSYPPLDFNGNIKSDIINKFTPVQDAVIFNGIINVTINDIGEALLFYIDDYLEKGSDKIKNAINVLNRVLYGFDNFNTSLFDRLMPTDNTLDAVIDTQEISGVVYNFFNILNPRGDYNNSSILASLVENPNRAYNPYELLRESYIKMINDEILAEGIFTQTEATNMVSIVDMFFTDNLPGIDEFIENGYSLYVGNGDDPFINSTGPLFSALQSSIARLIYLNQRQNYNSYCFKLLNQIQSGVTNGSALEDYVNVILDSEFQDILLDDGTYDFYALREYSYTDRDNNLITNFRIANDGLTANNYFNNIDTNTRIYTDTYFYFTGAYPWSFFIDTQGTIPADVSAELEALTLLTQFKLERREYFYGFFDNIIDAYLTFLGTIPNLNLTFFREFFAYLPSSTTDSMGNQILDIVPITSSSDIKSSAQLKGFSKAPMDFLVGDPVIFTNSIVEIFSNLILSEANPFDPINESNMFDLYENIHDPNYGLNKNSEIELFKLISDIDSTELWTITNQINLRFNNFNFERDIYNFLNELVLIEANLGSLSEIDKISNEQIFNDLINSLLDEKRKLNSTLCEINESGNTKSEKNTIDLFKKILSDYEFNILLSFVKDNYNVDFENLINNYGLKNSLVDSLDINDQVLSTTNLRASDAISPLLNIIGGIQIDSNNRYVRIREPIDLEDIEKWFDEIDFYFEESETNPISGGRNFTDPENLGRAILAGNADTFYKRIDDQFFSNEWQLINLLLQPTAEDYYILEDGSLPANSYRNFGIEGSISASP